MNINKHHYLSILALISLILLSFPQTVLSQGERIAVISKFEGEVRIKHEGEWKTVTSVGNRIRNSSVYSDDTIMTMPGSTADLVFDDNTRLEVNEDTTLTISTRQMAEEERRQEGFIRRVADTQQDIVRNVNVHVGKIWANITPSKSVLTEFETPTGVASVRGTTLTIEFSGGVTTIDLIAGLVDFASAGNEVSFDIGSGDSLNVSIPAAGKVEVDVKSGDGVDIDTGIGTANVGAGEGAGVQVVGDKVIVSADGDITLETSKGTVTIKDGGFLDVIINPETLEIEVIAADGVTITTDGITTNVDVETSLGTAGASDEEIAAAIEGGAGTAAMDDPVVDDPNLVVDDPNLVVDDPNLVVDDPNLVVDDPNLVVIDPNLVVVDPNLVGFDPNTLLISSTPDPDPVNNSPVAGEDDGESWLIVTEDNTLTIQESDVLANDSDPDGDSLTVNSFDGTTAQGGTVEEGSLIYTPPDDFFGQDSFTYTISDGSGGTDEATVNVTVNPVNDAPYFTNGSNQNVNEDAGQQTIPDWATNILAGPANEYTRFSGDFSSGGLSNWDSTDNAIVDTGFGSEISSKDGTNGEFAIITTGSNGQLSKQFNFTEAGNRNITFDYNFVPLSNPTVLTFDGVGDTWSWVQDGYGGLNWQNIVLADGTQSNLADTGYFNGIVSGTFVGASPNHGSATITGISGNTFDFLETYMSALWGDGLQVTFTGSAGGTQIYDTTVTVDDTGPNLFQFDFLGIDILSIQGAGGTGAWPSYALDNFTLNSIQDNVEVHLHKSDGNIAILPLLLTSLTSVSGLSATVLDESSGYQTGWLSVDWTGEVPAGETMLHFHVNDDGDNVPESALLIDNVVAESGQTLTFNVTNDNNALFSVQPSINHVTGELSYTLANSTPGTANLTVSLKDDGGVANGGVDTTPTQEFTITVNDILNKGSEAMELLNYYGMGGLSIPENPNSVVIGNDFFSFVDISPDGYIHGGYDNEDGSDGEDGLVASIIDANNDDEGIIYDDGYGISFNKTGTSGDLVATFRDVEETGDEEGPNIEQGGTKGTSFYSRATGNSVIANTSFDDLLISHDYRLTDDGNVLVADVTITNIGDETISNLKYRKKVDFDVDEFDGTVIPEDLPIDDFVVPLIGLGDTLIESVAAPYYSTVKNDPTGSDMSNSAQGTYTDDNAAVFQLDLGTLEPDESITFPVFFAGDDSSTNLQDSINKVIASTKYIEVSDPSESDAVFALGAGVSSITAPTLTAPTGVVSEDKDHFKLLVDSMSVMIGHLSKESYSSHAETIVDGLSNPTAIAIDDGHFFVTDSGAGKVFELTESGGSWSVVTIADAEDGIGNPTGIAVDVDSSGGGPTELFVTDSSANKVFKITESGGSWNVTTIADAGDGIVNPTGIDLDDDSSGNQFAIVTDNGADKVFKLTESGGAWTVSEIASEGSTGSRIDEPQGIAILSGGEFRVVDTGSDAVMMVDPWDGSTFRLGTEGSTHGKIDEPVDIVVDDDGFLYIVDSHNNSITKVTTGGFEDPKFIASAGTTDTIGNPVGIAIDNNNTSSDTSDDIIYIIDDEKNSVVKLTKTTNDKTLLAFANKLRADLKAHGNDFSDAGHNDIVSNNTINLDSIISKIQQNVSSPNTVSNTEIISDLESVRADLMVHADLESIFDHVDITHLIGDARNIAAKSSDNGVQLNLDVIEVNLDKANEYLQTHIDEPGISTEHDNIMTRIDDIKTDIGLVRNNIFDWIAIERVEDGLDNVFKALVDHTSPNNNPFAFLKDFDNEDAVDLMFHNGTGGAFIPSLAINTVNKIDNGTLEAGISQDGSLIEPNTDNANGGIGLVLNGFDNGGNENGDVLTPGSPNEGYGVSYDAGGNSFLARIGSGDGASSSSYDTSIYTKSSQYNSETFTHKVGVDRDDLSVLTDSTPKGDLDITHKFELAPPDLHIGAEGWGWEKMMAVTVTMTNTGTDPITNLKYRRVADFDNGNPDIFLNNKFTVPDTGSITSGDATLESAGAPDFFPDYDPGTSGSSPPGDYTGDLTALLQFDLDTLAAGESKTFNFFYAADKSSDHLSGNINSLVTDARYVSSTRDGSQPYHTFALGTGSSNGIVEEDMTTTESQHFNILTDSLSLMLRDLALTTYAAQTVADYGSSGGWIDGPRDVAINSSGDLIVANQWSKTVVKIEKDETSSTGTGYKDTVSVIHDDDIGGPSGVAIDSNGDLIVTDWSSQVVKIEKTDDLDTYPTGYKSTIHVIADYDTYDDVQGYQWIYEPYGVALDNDGNIIVAEQWHEAILKIEKNDGSDGSTTGYGDPDDENLTVITDYYSSDYLIDAPTDVAVAKNGDIIVTDWGSPGAVLRVDPVTGETEVIADFSSTGGLISSPKGIAIDSNGLLIITNKSSWAAGFESMVLKIDPVTGDTRVIATGNSTDDKIDKPYGLAIDNDGSILVADYGDSAIRKLEETTSTDYLLAFAQKIRGDMVTHDYDHPGDDTSHAEHDAFIEAVDGVITDIGTNISDPNTEDKMDIFNDLKSARDSLMVHADMKEPVQHASIAHLLLDSKRLADDQVRLNLVSIDEEMNQAKNFLDAHINDFGDTTVHRDISSQMNSILASINTVKGNIYDTATASQISSGIKEAFCDVIDHMVHSDAGHGNEGHHEENPFVFCHHEEASASM